MTSEQDVHAALLDALARRGTLLVGHPLVLETPVRFRVLRIRAKPDPSRNDDAGRVESWLVVEGPEQAAACARDAQDAWAWDGIDGDDGELGQPSSVWTHESAVGADPAERAAIERFRKQHPAVHDVEIQRVDGTLVPFHFADTAYGGYFDPVRGGLCIEGRPPWSLRQKLHQIVRNAGGARHLLGTLFFGLATIELGLLWIAFARDCGVDLDVDESTYLVPLGVNSVLLGIVATVYNLDRHP